MIKRYETPEMANLWNETTKLHLWTMVEMCAAEAKGLDREALAVLRHASPPSPRQVEMEEMRTQHDVAAFVKMLQYEVGMMTAVDPEAEKRAVQAVHQGLTSSDVVDSANGVRWAKSAELIAAEGRGLVEVLAEHALTHRATRRVGRTHGQWAEETSWGKLMAEKTLLVERAVERVERARRAVGLVKLSGPVGDYKTTSRGEELKFAELLGAVTRTEVRAAESSTQIVARDGLVELMDACKALGGAVASIACEVRLASQSGIGEVEEGRGDGQMGSSSMPHKRNPIICEQLIGLYRVISAESNSVSDSVVSWGERDISHSAVERTAVVDVLGLTHYSVRKMKGVVKGLVVNREAMTANAEKAETVTKSATVLNWLVQAKVDRTEAWELVNKAAAEAEDVGEPLTQAVRRVAKSWPRASAELEQVNWVGLRGGGPAEGRMDHLWEAMGRRTRLAGVKWKIGGPAK